MLAHATHFIEKLGQRNQSYPSNNKEKEGVFSNIQRIYAFIFVHLNTIPGDPSPRVTWWRENELVDSSDEKTYTSVVQNTLRIGPLTPSDLGSVYTCTSANNNVSAPVSQRVTIDLVYPPTDVSITTVGQPLVAGTTYVLSCEAAGSRPDPVISWWLASKLMKEDATQMVEKIKDITKSTIYFTPSTEDHGKIIACRAENTLIEDSGIDDNWSLTVYCKQLFVL